MSVIDDDVHVLRDSDENSLKSATSRRVFPDCIEEDANARVDGVKTKAVNLRMKPVLGLMLLL